MPPGQANLPLAELVATARQGLGLSLAKVQKRVRDTASHEGAACGFDRQAISKIENGKRVPHPDALRWLAIALELPVDIVVAAANKQRGTVILSPYRDLRTHESVEWVADHSPLSYEQAYEAIAYRATRLEARDPTMTHRRAYLRAKVPRSQIAAALTGYYLDPSPNDFGASFYKASVAGEKLALSILVKANWLAAAIQLNTGDEQFQLISSAPEPRSDRLSGLALEGALDRLANVEILRNPFVNNPLYRLLGIEVATHKLDATVALADFASYGLSLDLLEAELLDALASNGPLTASGFPHGVGQLPLRSWYLPSTAEVLDLSSRLCAGGPVALFAAARSSTRSGKPDYALLIQERSSKVLNVTGKLAVVPKAFHAPIVEAAAEVSLSASLEREIEEELLGRDDLEGMSEKDLRMADPFHVERLSEPMRWLVERRHTDAVRFECVGFGINAVTGNYEFPCLVVVDDDEWWARYGGRIEANWEIKRIRRYSSRDTAGLQALISAPGWSNEGLFAFIEGLRRLAELDTLSRVALPTISVEA